MLCVICRVALRFFGQCMMLLQKKPISLLILSVLFAFFNAGYVASQSVTINEVMASNASTIADEDGDFSDWIELFNHGQSAISLQGFGLTDDPEEPFKWIFPDTLMEPGQHLLVWASGKDRRSLAGDLANGLIREVYTGIPGSSVADLTNHPDYPDNPSSVGIVRQLFEAPTDVGDHYGQRIHGWIKAPATGQYTFWISGDDNCALYLSTSDDPADVVLIAQVPGWNTPREWSKYAEQRSSPVTLEEGMYYYVMALMKEHEGGDHLAVGWQLPDGTFDRPVSGHHLFGGQAGLHANFRIDASGEEIMLSSPDGEVISQAGPVTIPTDVSYGRVPDGTGNWFFFQEPTPGSTNQDNGYSEMLTPPQFSVPGGFYSDGFSLSLTHEDADVQIIYTLDGSEPDPENLQGSSYLYKNQYPQNAGHPFSDFLSNTYQSNLYATPIQVYDRSDEPDKLSRISTTYHRSPSYFPESPVKKGMVIRAMAVKPGALPSNTITNSYFVNGEGVNPYTLPLFSISLPEDALFDYDDGIYVAGKIFEEWRSGNSSSNANGGTPANYWMRGVHTEKPAHLEFFEQNASSPSLSQDIGLRLHGGWSRAHPLKSLRLYARNLYDESSFNYPFFSDLPYTSYKRLVLRNSGNDFYNTYIRDAAIHRIVSYLTFDTQAYQPAIVFINGEYWGIHNARERQDKHYLERIYGVDPENIDLLENDGGIIEGDADHYRAMLAFAENNLLSVQANYEYIKTLMDVQNFIDYQIANIFVANTDWPGNNIKYWRLKADQYNPDAPHGHDGRWRWLMYDTDFGFSMYGPLTHNTLQFAAAPNGPGWPNPPWSTYLLRKLLTNNSFKNDFINRFADLMNTGLQSSRIVAIIKEMKQLLEPELPEHIHRWSSPGWGSLNTWNSDVSSMINFANQRPAYQRNHIRSYFGINVNSYLTLDVGNTAAGYIRVNTIAIHHGTPGVSDQPYPWTGHYYGGIPIEVEAVPRKGYVFSHWSGSSSSNDALLQITPSGNLSLKAHFASVVEDPALIHYWHFNDLTGERLPNADPDFSRVAGADIVYEGTGEGYMDARTHRDEDPVSDLNLQAGQQPGQGAVLRVRNPSANRALVIKTPASGYENIKVSFAVARTTNGATQQEFLYSSNGGLQWNLLESAYPVSLQIGRAHV